MAYADKKSEDDRKSSSTAPSPLAGVVNSPIVAVFAYCASSILMTVTNKYVLSVGNFNFNCILLAIQVCAIVLFSFYFLRKYFNASGLCCEAQLLFKFTKT